MREGLPVHGAGGEAVEREDADGADGGDFAAAFGDRGIHGVERAEDGADGHDGGHESTENGNELGHARGLLGVVVDFAADIDVEARVGGDSVFELLQGIGGREMDGDGLEDVGGALVDVIEDARVAPDFGIEGAAAGIEHADDLPMAAAEINGVADGQTGIAGVGVFADDQLGKARAKHAALNDFGVGADGEDVGGNAANLHVGIGAGGAQGEGGDHHDFGSDQRAVGVAGHSGRILHNLDLVESNAAHHFRGRAGAHDDGVLIGAGGDERGSEAAGEGKHGDENADGAGDAEDGDDDGCPAGLYASEVVDNRDSHFRPSEAR